MEPLHEETSTKYFGIITIAIVLPVSLIVYHFSDAHMAISTLFFTSVIVFAAVMKWEFKNKIWFWMTLLVLAILQVPLIRSIRFPGHYIHGIVLLPIFALYLLLVLSIIRLVGNVLEDPK